MLSGLWSRVFCFFLRMNAYFDGWGSSVCTSTYHCKLTQIWSLEPTAEGWRREPTSQLSMDIHICAAWHMTPPPPHTHIHTLLIDTLFTQPWICVRRLTTTSSHAAQKQSSGFSLTLPFPACHPPFRLSCHHACDRLPWPRHCLSAAF